MSKPNNNSENPEPVPPAPPPATPANKGADGRFKSKAQMEVEKELKDVANKYLVDNNALRAVALQKRGVKMPTGVFEGMDPFQVNKFLVNMEKGNPEVPPEPTPNGPILGTPVGGGKSKTKLDTYMTVDMKNRSFEMDVPSSVLFGKAKDSEEAEEKWSAQL